MPGIDEDILRDLMAAAPMTCTPRQALPRALSAASGAGGCATVR
jgi:hypothetical protein